MSPFLVPDIECRLLSFCKILSREAARLLLDAYIMFGSTLFICLYDSGSIGIGERLESPEGTLATFRV